MSGIERVIADFDPVVVATKDAGEAVKKADDSRVSEALRRSGGGDGVPHAEW